MTIVFRTPRLYIRRFVPADAAALATVCGNRRTMRYVGDGTTLDVDDCRAWIDESLRDYALRGYGASAVCVDDVPGIAGYCGIVPAGRRADLELIYALHPRWWGQGLGTELVAGLVAFGFDRCGLPRLVAAISPDNPASQRVVEKAGLHCAGEELGEGGLPMLVYVAERRSSVAGAGE